MKKNLLILFGFMTFLSCQENIRKGSQNFQNACIGDQDACIGDQNACIGDQDACIGDQNACIGEGSDINTLPLEELERMLTGLVGKPRVVSIGAYDLNPNTLKLDPVKKTVYGGSGTLLDKIRILSCSNSEYLTYRAKAIFKIIISSSGLNSMLDSLRKKKLNSLGKKSLSDQLDEGIGNLYALKETTSLDQ